jgi:hypothetical protein
MRFVQGHLQMTNCWFVYGLVSCWGPSLEERRSFEARPKGVFSQACSGTEIICRSEKGEPVVVGEESFVMQRLAGQPSYLRCQQE